MRNSWCYQWPQSIHCESTPLSYCMHIFHFAILIKLINFFFSKEFSVLTILNNEKHISSGHVMSLPRLVRRCIETISPQWCRQEEDTKVQGSISQVANSYLPTIHACDVFSSASCQLQTTDYRLQNTATCFDPDYCPLGLYFHSTFFFLTWLYKDSELVLTGTWTVIVSLLQDLVDGSIFEQGGS